jgi:hypothetical protein
MSVTTVMILAALGASVVLVMQLKARLFPVIALAASALEALLAFRVFKLSFSHMGLILGGALVVAGVAIWMKTGSKTPVTAATTVMLVGAIQVLAALL